MKNRLYRLLCCVAGGLVLLSCKESADKKYITDAIGTDARKPRLTPVAIASDDMRHSKKVSSTDGLVSFDGTTFKSFTAYDWIVSIPDENNNPSMTLKVALGSSDANFTFFRHRQIRNLRVSGALIFLNVNKIGFDSKS